MKNALLILPLAAGLLLGGCDLGKTSSAPGDAKPRFSPQDYRKALESLARVDTSPTAATASKQAQALAKARKQVEKPLPKDALAKTLQALPSPQRPHIERMLQAARTSRDLEGIEQAVGSATERARNALSGADLARVLEVRALVLGSARHWSTQGLSFNGPANANTNTTCTSEGLRGSTQALPPSCKPVPVKEDYTNFYLAVSKGFLSFVAGCGLAGGVGFWAGGPIGAYAGCMIVGGGGGGIAMTAERERQRDRWKETVRQWCRECKDEHWQNARYCNQVL